MQNMNFSKNHFSDFEHVRAIFMQIMIFPKLTKTNCIGILYDLVYVLVFLILGDT